MKAKYTFIMGLAAFLISICLPLTVSYASQSATEAEGVLSLELIKAAKALQPSDKLLVWIDINATTDRFGYHYLPADPSLYGIKWITITFAPDIKESNLFWCLAEIQTHDVEEILTIPWVFNITLIRVGGLGDQSSISPKLTLGFQEVMDRALQHNGILQVIVWMENSSHSSVKSSVYSEGIGNEIVHNVTVTIEQFGGRFLRDHYEGCHSLLAALPAKSIVRITENPFIKKLYLNGPAVPEGFDNTTRLYDSGKTKDSINPYPFGLAVLWSPVVLSATVTSEKKTKKKIQAFLTIVTILSLTFILQMTPSIKALDVSTSAIRATDVWATGNTGGGINVAVIDLGFDINHNDLAPAIVHRINAHDWSNNVGGNERHGTLVAGIVAGRGINNNLYRGVAWGAGLVLVKVLGDADFEPAIRWIIDNHAQHNIRAITMSLYLVNVPPGGDGLESPASIAMDDAVENDIVAIKSAGNLGHEGSKTITSPGNAFNIITVGATNDMNTPDINDDELAYYPDGYRYKGRFYDPWGSSKGPTKGISPPTEGRPKPDVVAPGVHIWSCRSANTGAGYYEDVSPDGFYGEGSGTSYAAPHVAGTVALMFHANPNLTPAQVKAILRQTARLNSDLSGLTVNDRGHGIIDAYEAVQLAQNVANIDMGQMYDAFDVRTPKRGWNAWESWDYLTFSVQPPTYTFGIDVITIDYHLRWHWGIEEKDYRLLWRIGAQHVWIDGTHYHLVGDNIREYLLSGPRITEKDDGYVMMRVMYKVGNVFVEYRWKMHVSEMWLRLNYTGGSSWKTLIYVDPEVWDTTNYPYLPSTDEIICYERKVIGDVLVNVREIDRSEFVQIDPDPTDNPEMWILRYGYFGNNPDDALNGESTYNQDIVVYYQGTSDYSGPVINREKQSLSNPATPSISGPTRGYALRTYTYEAVTADHNGDDIRYEFDWGDTSPHTWTQFTASGVTVSASHSWQYAGTYLLQVRAHDNGHSGGWSQLQVTIDTGGGGSCPFVYSWDGRRYYFDHEAYPFAVMKSAETTSYDRLEYLKEVDGEYRLRIEQVLHEVAWLDSFDLYVVDHPDNDSFVMPDLEGNLHTVKELIQPISAYEKNGDDCLEDVKYFDYRIWQDSVLDANVSDESTLRNWIVLTFPKPDATTAKLLLNVKKQETITKEWEFFINVIGENYWNLWQKIMEAPVLTDLFLDTLEREIELSIEVWNGVEWTKQGSLSAGDSIWDDFLVVLDISDIQGDELQVRLKSTTGHYQINYVGIDYSEDEPMTIHKINPYYAVKNGEEDVLATLEYPDETYVTLMPNDVIELKYSAIPKTEWKRDYTIATKGYYNFIDFQNRTFSEFLEGIALWLKAMTEPYFVPKTVFPYLQEFQ